MYVIVVFGGLLWFLSWALACWFALYVVALLVLHDLFAHKKTAKLKTQKSGTLGCASGHVFCDKCDNYYFYRTYHGVCQYLRRRADKTEWVL